jgi:hypothetical protein
MGTRSLTVFQEFDKEIVVMYRQFDGYPEGHGMDLAEFLAGGKMVNGLSLGDNSQQFNGMGCLAAQVIAHFKEEAGGFYLHKAGTRDAGEEYIYVVKGKTGEEPSIEVWDVPYNDQRKMLHAGTASEVLEWCKTGE